MHVVMSIYVMGTLIQFIAFFFKFLAPLLDLMPEEYDNKTYFINKRIINSIATKEISWLTVMLSGLAFFAFCVPQNVSFW